MRNSMMFFLLALISCRQQPLNSAAAFVTDDRSMPVCATFATGMCDTGNAYAADGVDTDLPAKLVAFAMTQIGVPYNYGCTTTTGFDCSGFVGFVFHHFNVPVPRSSVDFTNEGVEIPPAYSKPGDVILFTGTNTSRRIVGHIGIIVANDNGAIRFIHASSGKENAVTISQLDNYYLARFMAVRRLVMW